MSHLYCAFLGQHQCNPLGEACTVNTYVWNITQNSGFFFFSHLKCWEMNILKSEHRVALQLQKVASRDLWNIRFRFCLCSKWKAKIGEMVWIFAQTRMVPQFPLELQSALLCPHSFLTGVREKPGTSAFTSRGGPGCHTAQAHAFKLPYGSSVTKPIGSKVYEQNKFGSVMFLYFQKTLSAS